MDSSPGEVLQGHGLLYVIYICPLKRGERYSWAILVSESVICSKAIFGELWL
jgi:hypothetical protein